MQKKLGRPAHEAPKTKEVQINEEAFEKAVLARDAAAIAKDFLTPEMAALHRTLGCIESMKAVSAMTNAISLQDLKLIKENKTYKTLKGQAGATPDGQPIDDLGTWEGFCRHLGMSVVKADEDLRNLVVFGQEALDRMSALGAGYRNLRQYRQLPEDKKQALIELAKSGDENAFLDLAEELMSRHTKEKEELTRQIEDGKKELSASEKRLEIVHREREAAESAEAKRALLTEAERLDEMRKDVESAVKFAWVDLRRVGKAMQDLLRADNTFSPVMAGLLKRVENELETIKADLSLPAVSSLPESALDWVEFQAKEDRQRVSR